MLHNIIYQTSEGSETDFEFAFNEDVIFSKLTHQNFFDKGCLQLVKENAIVVYSSNYLRISPSFEKYLNKLDEYVLLHCSNESLNHLTGYYKKAKAVLRSGGWNPNITRNNVFSVPLAFQSEFLNVSKKQIDFLNQRFYVWSFFGSLKGDRTIMYEQLKSVGPYFHFQSKGWMDPDNKTPEDVISYYKNSIFVPSPAGNIYFECNRTMDALEWGCIPVSIKFLGEDCYKYLYGDHPFIVGENWEDVARQMNELLSDPIKLKEKQRTVNTWYTNFKSQLAEDVEAIVTGNFNKISGKQFLYQRKSKNNWKLRWRFFKYFTCSVYWKRFTSTIFK
ncbi:hypothetical protein [Sphingobacterium sp. UBA7038]|uniref:hypothetical protein n=1 Tax=Sphingobacterium TaxID=28453 RepID=UPI00258094C1|nr:hypothetical protein [Sphingobacterium sp. UBA7038]